MACQGISKSGNPCKWPTDFEWCWHHDPAKADERAAALEASHKAKETQAVTCLWCGRHLNSRQTRWCKARCKEAGQKARKLGLPLRSGLEVGENSVRAVSKGDYAELLSMKKSGMTDQQMADYLDTTPSTISRRLKQGRADEFVEAQREGWEPPSRDYSENLRELGKKDVPALIADFLWFRSRYFLTPEGDRYLTPRFQKKWLKAIIRNLVTGGRLIILSPPRHGKTDLLNHITLWLICRFPNIRIIWVGGNADIAKQSVSAILDQLEGNEELIADFCPPGVKFKPAGKQNVIWTQAGFRVATRTQRGIKQPTVKAVGKNGRTRSMDCDFIICDDIEDEKSTVSPMGREETRRWWTGVNTRVTGNVAMFLIGSRADSDDLLSYLLDNPVYESIVESAHAMDCVLDPFDEGLHVDCMLFPEINNYGWLRKQEQALDIVPGQFELMYQNKPNAQGLDTFTAELLLPCQDENYHIGEVGLEGPYGLVAGLDPAHTGYQASVLWAFQTETGKQKIQLVDTENRKSHGIAAVIETVENWHALYGVTEWVIEYNLFRSSLQDDPRLRDLRQQTGVHIEDFRTYRNKIDPRFGVTGMVPLFASKQIILPFATGSQQKTTEYVKQLLRYDPAYKNRNPNGSKSDIVMAGWFPMDLIRRAGQAYIAEMGVEYDGGYRISNWDTVPWGELEQAPWARSA